LFQQSFKREQGRPEGDLADIRRSILPLVPFAPETPFPAVEVAYLVGQDGTHPLNKQQLPPGEGPSPHPWRLHALYHQQVGACQLQETPLTICVINALGDAFAPTQLGNRFFAKQAV